MPTHFKATAVAVLLGIACLSSVWTADVLDPEREEIFESVDHSIPSVTLEQGTYLGLRQEVSTDKGGTSAVSAFLGIPFGQPPQRFQAPKLVSKSGGTFRAQQRGNACIQAIPASAPEVIKNAPQGTVSKAVFPESEDCLNLNVWAPDTPGKKPVMIWLYGGAFMFGRNSLGFYDGAHLAAHGVVIVAPNYRVNVFGFPGFVDEIPQRQSNLGLLDQRLAFEWVQQNIAKFGGDPESVTLFGQSAGAISIDHHLATYSENNVPFRAAILQSGVAEEGFLKTLGSGGNAQAFKELAVALECPTNMVFECVRSASPEDIVHAMQEENLTFMPVVDGLTVVSDPVHARNRPDALRVPVMYGSTGQEASVFIVNFFEDGDISVPLFLTMFVPNQGQATAKVIEAYSPGPGKRYKNSFEALTAFVTDAVFTCPVAKEARRSAERKIPTWRYFYNATFPSVTLFPGAGAYHSSEIPILFDNLPAAAGPEPREQRSVSRSMAEAWTNFAKSPKGGPGWAPLGPGTSSHAKADTAAVWTESGRRKSVNIRLIDQPCALVDGLYVRLPNLM